MTEKKATEKTVKLYPPGDKPVLIALTTGHTFGVPAEGCEVPQRYVRDALALGCMPEGMQGVVQPVNTTEPSRMDAVIKGIEVLMREVDAEPTLATRLLTGDKRPDAIELSRRVGFAVPAALRDEAWEIYQAGGDD